MPICRYADVADSIRLAPPRCGDVRLVAVDGRGGSGKSTFAERLVRHLGGAPVIHTDDFASWDDPLGWWHRLEAEALRPLERGEAVRYRRYDWVTRQLGDWRELSRSEIVVLEGVSSSRQAVADRLSLAVWIEAPKAKRLARGIDRDGPEMLPAWEQWMAEEDAHYLTDGAVGRADVIVDGAPQLPHDPEEEFVRIR